jgi:hypothetical protein
MCDLIKPPLTLNGHLLTFFYEDALNKTNVGNGSDFDIWSLFPLGTLVQLFIWVRPIVFKWFGW